MIAWECSEKAMASDEWVIAVKRDKTAEVPRGWIDTVRGTPGVSRCASASRQRAQVTATPAAVEAIRAQLGEYVIVEPVMPRQRL